MRRPIFYCEISRPGTCWWNNVRNKDGTIDRLDSLFCIERTFFRDLGIYCYSICCGRLTIGIIFP